MATFILGLSQIKVGEASEAGVMPEAASLTKLGMTYQDTCKIAQDADDVTEHYEEGNAVPAIRRRTRKTPKITFSIMNPDAQLLADYVGGAVATDNWEYDSTSVIANKAISIVTEQGYDFNIPNADIMAVVNAELSQKGIFLVDFTVTPLYVTNGKPLIGVKKA